MKKLTLYLLLFAMLLSLVSCLNTGDGTETTTDSESESETTTPAESESTTPDESESDPIPDDPKPNPFSNGIEIESIVAVNNKGTKQEITPQATGEVLGKLFPDGNTWWTSHWTYDEREIVALRDEEGGAVLLDRTNAKLYHYPKREAPTTEELKQITNGMPLLEVVNLLGYLPDHIGGSGTISILFYSCQDTLFCMNWGVDEESKSTTVVNPYMTYVNRYNEEPLLPASQVEASSVEEGMSKDTLVALLPDDQRIDWGEHLLFRDKSGQSVIVTLDESNTVTKVSVYAPPAEHPTKEQVFAFHGTEKTIHDYVEAFGLPYCDTGRETILYIMTTDGSAVIGSAFNDQHRIC